MRHCKKENHHNINVLGGFLVARVGETSNLELVKDLADVVEYLILKE
jgi:hypothetical protein